MKRISFLFIVLTLLLFTSCSTNITKGEIVGKYTIRPHVIEKVYYTRNKDEKIPVKYYKFYDRQWIVELEDYDKKQDKTIYGEQHINEETYHRLEIGKDFSCDYYDCLEKPIPEDIPNNFLNDISSNEIQFCYI